MVLSYDIWLHLLGYLRHWSGMNAAYMLEGKQIPTTWMEKIEQRGVQTLLEVCGAFIPLLAWRYSLKELAIPLAFIAARGLTRHEPQGTCDIGKDSTSKFGEYSTSSQFGTSYLHSVEDGAS